MSRTVADATRFTATSPHAYSKPASILRPSSFAASGAALRSSQKQQQQSPRNPNNPPSQPPPNETPQQKVARLRALRAAEKNKPLDLWDRTVLRGRRWADIAHRVTAYSLMGFSVLAGIITVYSLTDMIMYNRKQRSVFFATQAAIYTDTLRSAIAAEQEHRPLTDDETAVLNREKMVLQAEAERQRLHELGWGKRIKAYLLGGGEIERALEAMDRESEMRAQQMVASSEGGGGGKGAAAVKRVEEVVSQERVMQVLEEKRKREEKAGEQVAQVEGEQVDRVREEEVHVEGGPLDQVAEQATMVSAEKAKGGWSSWFGGSR
ncbi:MAG: hypothetical protein Q9219_005713 [cf. Caloplaca sp. 3 TL-2023]